MRWNNPKKKARANKKVAKMKQNVANSRERQRALTILRNL